MVIPKNVKTDILDTLGDSMVEISAYPERAHYESVLVHWWRSIPVWESQGPNRDVFMVLQPEV